MDAAEALARQQGELMLDGLLHLPAEVANEIARHRGTLLTFESLRFLSDGLQRRWQGYGGKVVIPIVEVIDGKLACKA